MTEKQVLNREKDLLVTSVFNPSSTRKTLQHTKGLFMVSGKDLFVMSVKNTSSTGKTLQRTLSLTMAMVSRTCLPFLRDFVRDFGTTKPIHSHF